MANDQDGPGGREEDRLRERLRIVAGVVFLICIAMAVIVTILGRIFVRPDFTVGDVFLGTLVGALLLIIGIESGKIPFIGGGK